MFRLYLVHKNTTTQLVSEYDDLDEAVAACIKMADDSGWPAPFTEHQRPDRLEVHSLNGLELSIKVLRGGLLGSKAGPKSEPM